jgi:hypothetical protein
MSDAVTHAGGHDDAHGKGTVLPDLPRLPAETARKATTMGIAALVIGLVLMLVGLAVDKHRFGLIYLTGFAFLASIGLGALFFVIIQHLTKAGWSVSARRQMEWITGLIPLCVLLFIPILIFSHDIYHHWMSPEAAADPVLQKKTWWLNQPFFYARAVIYLATWTALAWWFGRTSAKQDESGDPKLTVKMQTLSAPMMMFFAITLSFAAFDWLMSLDPHWYSTIFGVYWFAGGITSSLSVLALVTIVLQKKGIYQKVSTVEHRHDIGKLLFAFTVFWAYIAFSQFILIWYADIPEEVIWYRHRWDHDWRYVSLTLFFGHFVAPFVLLMSRHTKRNYLGLAIGASISLVMHFVDMYWLVMPTQIEHFHLHWMDIAVFIGALAVVAGVVLWRSGRGNIFPLRDPRLPETIKLENL